MSSAGKALGRCGRELGTDDYPEGCECRGRDKWGCQADPQGAIEDWLRSHGIEPVPRTQRASVAEVLEWLASKAEP